MARSALALAALLLAGGCGFEDGELSTSDRAVPPIAPTGAPGPESNPPTADPGTTSAPPESDGGRADAGATDAGRVDAGHPDAGAPDAGTVGPIDAGTGVGVHGGSVGLLHFGVTGDTRPPACEDTANYPSAILEAIAGQLKARSAQFVVDLGDHMYVCNGDFQVATAQMNLYLAGVAHYGKAWFMTEGNHECWHGPCYAGSTETNYVAFMNALAPYAKLPYYSFDVTTALGLATFVVIADNSFDSAQASWLDATLTTADAKARYTIVVRHHPEGDTSIATNAQSMQIIRAHKFALLLTGHSHEYHHMTVDNGRDVILGIGGAPLISTGTFNGFAMVDQQLDGNLKVSVFDSATQAQQDVFTVPPNL